MSNPYKIGETVKSNEGNPGYKDAFHIPAVLVFSDGKLKAGDRVKFLSPQKVIKTNFSKTKDYDAIVDPYIEKSINVGEFFWVFIKPSLVKNLTHTFEIFGWESCPAPELINVFDDEGTIDSHEKECRTEGCW